VDTKTDQLIRNAMHSEIPDTTKIIIAQRVASVQESDLIVVLEAGEILATGTHDELLESCEEYRSIYESQTKNRAAEAAQVTDQEVPVLASDALQSTARESTIRESIMQKPTAEEGGAR
jgi:ATP-binding cassette subfamily B protein